MNESAKQIEYRGVRFGLLHAQAWDGPYPSKRVCHELVLFLGNSTDDPVRQLCLDTVWEECKDLVADPGEVVYFLPKKEKEDWLLRVVSLCDVRRQTGERKYPTDPITEVIRWSFWTERIHPSKIPNLEVMELTEA